MARDRPVPRSDDLLERGRELDEIDTALKDASAGVGRLMLIEGPAGIGKTALLEAARARAREAGLVVLSARAGELEGHFPYGVVRQLFEPLLRASTSSASELLTGAARLAAPVVLDKDTQPAAADASRGAGFAQLHGLYWLTVNLSERSPVLITIDDAHWADGPSLRFLLYLSRRLEGVPASVTVSARSGEAGSEQELTARLAAEPWLRVLRPAALTEPAVAQLLAARLQMAPNKSFAAACHAATGGIPFLVHELLTTLIDDEIEPSDEQAAHVQRLAPRTVARATLGRLGRMSSGCVALARSIAVLAGDAQLPRAARLAALTESDALQALDALVDADVVRAGGRLEFIHPIVRAAIYDELAPGERSRLHREAARLLAEEGAELDAVATHLLASEPTGAPEVIAQLREAAAVAVARGAPEDAAAYLSRALREGCERDLRAELTFELGIAAKLDAQPSMAERFSEARRLARDPVLRNRAALELAWAVTMRGEWDSALALAETALADLGGRAPELTIRLERFRAGSAVYDRRIVGEFDRRLPELRELVARAGDPARSLALLLAAAAAFRGEPAREVVGYVDRGWDGGRALSGGFDEWTLGQGIAALVIIDNLERARELTDEVLADARVRGSLFGYLVGTMYRGWIEARAGHVNAAEAEFRAALEPMREHGLSFGLPSVLGLAVEVLVERPQAGDMAAVIETVKLGSLVETFSGALLLEVRGRLRHLSGQTASGIDDLRTAGEICRALGFCNPNGTGWRSALALMLGGDERAEAQRLAEEELADAVATGQPRGIGVALRTLGQLERGARGRARLERAVDVLARSPARLEYARALIELGSALRRNRESRAAREPLRAGLDLAVAGGATRSIDRALSELDASGARPRRLRATGRDALTPSELRVARLVVEGHTNKEVAQALFVTTRTVDTHLLHVYAKLDISSRQQLGAALDAGRGPPD